MTYDLHVQELKKRDHRIIIGDTDYKFSEFDTFKEEMLEEIKNVKYNDLEDMVHRFQLTDDEIINILDFKYIPPKKTDYFLNPTIYQKAI